MLLVFRQKKNKNKNKSSDIEFNLKSEKKKNHAHDTFDQIFGIYLAKKICVKFIIIHQIIRLYQKKKNIKKNTITLGKKTEYRSFIRRTFNEI